MIDSTFDNKPSPLTSKIISKYKPKVDSLLIPIGKSEYEILKGTPESPLSNLAADIIKEYATEYLKKNKIKGKVDLAMTNMGGIRTSFPKGNITSYDVLSVFPFDNRVVIATVLGKDIKIMFDTFAKRERSEAISGAKFVIKDKETESLLIGGKPVKDNKKYNIATIDFLLTGGDSVYALKRAISVIETNAMLMNVVIEYIKNETAQGRVISSEKDGRVTIIKD